MFHDLFGHVPLLFNPIFADHMQEYGKGGLKAHAPRRVRNARAPVLVHDRVRTDPTAGRLARLRRRHPSSSGASCSYCVDEPEAAAACRFDLERVDAHRYQIDRYQETYFVIDSFEQLMRRDRAGLHADLRAPQILSAAGSHDTSAGKATSSPTSTRSATRKGSVPR